MSIAAGLQSRRAPPLTGRLKRAVHAKRAFITPTRLAGIHDKPAVNIRDQPILGHPQRGFAGHDPLLTCRHPLNVIEGYAASAGLVDA